MSKGKKWKDFAVATTALIVFAIIVVAVISGIALIRRYKYNKLNEEQTAKTVAAVDAEIEQVSDKIGTIYSGPTMWQDLLGWDAEYTEQLDTEFQEHVGSKAETLTYEVQEDEPWDILWIKATVGDKTYYLRVDDTLFNIYIIREDAPDGEIVYEKLRLT